MRRSLIALVAVAIACSASAGAFASTSRATATSIAPTSPQGSFVTVPNPLAHQPAAAYQHVSGLGRNGYWQGWHVALDYILITDCSQVCTIDELRWEIYKGPDAIWGSCTTPAPLEHNCVDSWMENVGGGWQAPLTVTGGTGRFAHVTGRGSAAGKFVGAWPVLVQPPSAGVLNIALSLQDNSV